MHVINGYKKLGT